MPDPITMTSYSWLGSRLRAKKRWATRPFSVVSAGAGANAVIDVRPIADSRDELEL